MFIDPIPTECKSTKSICAGLNTNRLTGGALFFLKNVRAHGLPLKRFLMNVKSSV